MLQTNEASHRFCSLLGGWRCCWWSVVVCATVNVGWVGAPHECTTFRCATSVDVAPCATQRCLSWLDYFAPCCCTLYYLLSRVSCCNLIQLGHFIPPVIFLFYLGSFDRKRHTGTENGVFHFCLSGLELFFYVKHTGIYTVLRRFWRVPETFELCLIEDPSKPGNISSLWLSISPASDGHHTHS